MMGNYHHLLLRRWWVLIVVVAVVLHAHGDLLAVQAAAKKQLVPCMYIFGDSLVDNGNNNNILSLARANYRPYGVDFPDGAAPPGRFTNGRTMVDLLADHLGFQPPFIPAYAMAQPSDYARGLNFASGAAGVRPETGNNLGGHYPLSEQVSHFRAVVGQIAPDGKEKRLGRCIYYVGMGSNDYLNNYFMPAVYSTSRQYTPEQYADVLVSQYTQQLRILYNNGARKVALMGVGQVGCSPNELAQQSSDGVTCVARINGAIEIFNRKVVELVDQFNTLPGAHFTYINAYGIFQDILRSPGANGLTVLNKGCCGVGRNNGQVTCLPFQTPCANRNEYLFWDAFHPTEAANILVGRRAYSAAQPSDVHPVDLQTLAQL